MDTNRIGPVIDASMVEQAVINYLRDTLQYYLADKERILQLGSQSIPMPKEWYASQDAYVPEQDGATPVLVIASPGGVGKVSFDGPGARVTWKMTATIYVSANRSSQVVGRNVRVYASCISAALIQNPSLGSPSNAGSLVSVYSVDLQPEKYNSRPSTSTQTLGVAEVPFNITVSNVFSKFGTVIDYTTDPYANPGPWPAVTSIGYSLKPQ